ncbi:hypothetical protein K435DRAFT_798891 [Dendrothele bispora CBS 962.96]|uniref:Uncharacterized protein n=1 Tax=Dendrothele bispora (strain CBS 962.96) TaxID=1314807 RepID=A0A4V4HFD1_DENBC|nr:hypothetical protein K435DRAFT_798891 [Dendrothele bispora CBS 962.96]
MFRLLELQIARLGFLGLATQEEIHRVPYLPQCSPHAIKLGEGQYRNATGNISYREQLPLDFHHQTSSWTAYNLLSACEACQLFDSSITTWSFFIKECNGNLSANTFYPSGLISDDEVQIPFYASVNPQTWTDMKFNPTQAKAITDQGRSCLHYSHADLGLTNPSDASPANATALLSPSSTSTSSDSNFDAHTTLSTKAIIGIAIGGLAAASIVGTVVRRRYSSASPAPAPVVTEFTSETHTQWTHTRW